MILVDPRAGSRELVAPLRAAGLPVEESHLDFGDVCWVGRGAGGADVFCGLEHKKLPDLVASLNTDRLAGHQLTGMLQMYDRAYLVVEGEWDADKSGRVVVQRAGLRAKPTPLKGAPPAMVLEQRVLTLAIRGGLWPRWTRHQRETVRYIGALYRWWSDHALDEHKSHLAMHAPDLDRSLLTPASDERYAIGGFPHVGYKLSAAAEQQFGSVWRAVNASEAEWAELTTHDTKGKARRLGPARAKKIFDALRRVSNARTSSGD